MAVATARDVLIPKFEQAERASERAFRAGALTYIEWAQVQSDVMSVRSEQLLAAVEAHRALIEIQRLTGSSFIKDHSHEQSYLHNAAGGACRPGPCRMRSAGRHGGPSRGRGQPSTTMRSEIDEKTADELGIRSAKVGPGTVRDAHEVQGLLTPIEGKHARVRARYAGPVQSVRVGVGDVVKAGQTLATIESNVSLDHVCGNRAFWRDDPRRCGGPWRPGRRPAAVRDSRTCLRCGWTCTCLEETPSTSRRECQSRSSGSVMALR